MGNRSQKDKLFLVLGVFVLGPIAVLSGILAVSWFIEFQIQCGLSLSYYCGTDKSFKAAVFAVVCGSSIAGIRNLGKRKSGQ